MIPTGIRSAIAERRIWVLAPVLALLLALHPTATKAAAESPATVDLAQTVARTTAETEEVIVSGRLSTLSDLRKAIVAAEDRLYNRFNALNDDWQYDIDCEVRAPKGTRIKTRICQARYVTEATRDAAVYGLRNTNTNFRFESDESIVASKLAEQRKRMLVIAQTDSQVQRAMVERSLLIERYEAVRKQKLAASWIVWN